MTLRKIEIEEINDSLQRAIRAARCENTALWDENRRLKTLLEAADTQYSRLSDYIKRLQAWAENEM